MPNYNFDLDLPIAKKTEQEVAEILKRVYNAKIISFNHTNEFDILGEVNGKRFTVEVKEDFTCERTGNVGVEFSCRGKPSGINTTKADYYIYKIHTKEFIVFVQYPVWKLKRIINEIKFFRVVNGGDIGSDSRNYLFKFDVFIDNGKVIHYIW